VWKGLREIPAGRTVSYGELAATIGTAARALGSACGANLVAPVVPCHRVVRSDGSLGGYEYGLPIKQWLLQHERSS
jgi:O-6-methylguanine DNA methyltransferase